MTFKLAFLFFMGEPFGGGCFSPSTVNRLAHPPIPTRHLVSSLHRRVAFPLGFGLGAFFSRFARVFHGSHFSLNEPRKATQTICGGSRT